MTKKISFAIMLALFSVHLSSFSQTRSKTELAMEKAGFVRIKDLDPSIKVSLMYTRPDNFVGKVLYNDLHEAYLHTSAAKALVKAQKILKKRRPDLSLIVYDAARPMHIQQKMWNAVAGTKKNIYVSNPARGGGLHNYGLAVDITLCNLQGDTIPMGTPVDYLGRRAHIDIEQEMIENGKMSRQSVANRRLLRSVMKEAGFKPLKTEWWHFNFKSRSEAKKYYKLIK